MKYPPIDKDTGSSVPRETQGSRAAIAAIERAQALACLVRDESADGIGAFLDRLDRDALYGLTVALAAMVPLDSTAGELLGWLDFAPAEAPSVGHLLVLPAGSLAEAASQIVETMTREAVA